MAEAVQTRSQTSAARTPEPGAGAEATKTVPGSEDPLVIRTDFSDQAAWESIVTAIKAPCDSFYAHVTFLDDPAFRALTSTQLLALVSDEYREQHSFLTIVDDRTIAEPEHPLIVVSLAEDDPDAEEPRYGREFRAAPSDIQVIENTLTVGNMDFQDFLDDVDEDGMFRRSN